MSTKASSLHMDDLQVESFFLEPESALYDESGLYYMESGERCIKAATHSEKYGSCACSVSQCYMATCPTTCLWGD